MSKIIIYYCDICNKQLSPSEIERHEVMNRNLGYHMLNGNTHICTRCQIIRQQELEKEYNSKKAGIS